MRNGENVIELQTSASYRIRRAVLVALVGGLALTGACLGSGQQEQVEPIAPTYVRVENRAYLDMNVYVYRSAQRIRLGTTSGNSIARYVIPANLLFGATPLRFQADPIGASRKPISEEVSVSPGDEVVLVIPPT